MKLLDRLVPERSVGQALQQRVGYGEAVLAGGMGYSLPGFTTFSFGGMTYTAPVSSTWGDQTRETIANSFEGYVANGLMANAVVFGLVLARMRVFTEARLSWQRFSKGRPSQLYSDTSLRLFERPWPGGVTGDMLALMLLDADGAGNAYLTIMDGEVVPMRPDWVDIMLSARQHSSGGFVGYRKEGYLYWQGGRGSGVDPVQFLADEVAHFAPVPDPLANYRGMSWLTPVIREIQSDGAATLHKLKWFEHAATPNLAVKLQITDPDQFERFQKKLEEDHSGVDNAYRTLLLGAGADVTVIGSNLKDMDFSGVQGAGEVRIASAAGVPPAVAGLSEGLQGSALNAGNFSAARRLFAETTLASLWRNAAGSLEMLCPPPDTASRLWFDRRDVPFLRDDEKDLAQVQSAQAVAIRQLVEAGYEPDSVVAAILANDWSLLTHTGLFSIQLQEAGSAKLPEPEDITGTANNPPTEAAVAADAAKLPVAPPQPVSTPAPRTPAVPGASSKGFREVTHEI